mmetsp:Transcript_105939/g.296546  ORF Transcript_105939/g.296546 Transcript_105939/m.296546 type:complete len:347 (-) Transcript_105939:201-1241(-)
MAWRRIVLLACVWGSCAPPAVAHRSSAPVTDSARHMQIAIEGERVFHDTFRRFIIPDAMWSRIEALEKALAQKYVFNGYYDPRKYSSERWLFPVVFNYWRMQLAYISKGYTANLVGGVFDNFVSVATQCFGGLQNMKTVTIMNGVYTEFYGPINGHDSMSGIKALVLGGATAVVFSGRCQVDDEWWVPMDVSVEHGLHETSRNAVMWKIEDSFKNGDYARVVSYLLRKPGWTSYNFERTTEFRDWRFVAGNLEFLVEQLEMLRFFPPSPRRVYMQRRGLVGDWMPQSSDVDLEYELLAQGMLRTGQDMLQRRARSFLRRHRYGFIDKLLEEGSRADLHRMLDTYLA